MRHPLQALLIAPGAPAREAIEFGEKTITIREGHRDYRPGPVMICCHIEPWCVMADVTEARHCTLAEVTKEEFQADGYRSRVEMLRDLQQFYKDLKMDSPVTVIRWKDVRGKLVDAARSA